MCAAWQLSVPAIGFTCFDHCQPGSKVARPTGAPCRLTSSRRPLLSLNGRVSSGELMLLRVMAPINALPCRDVLREYAPSGPAASEVHRHRPLGPAEPKGAESQQG